MSTFGLRIPEGLGQGTEEAIEERLEHTRVDNIIEDNGLDPDEGIDTRCDACTLPIFSTFYTIIQDIDHGHDGHRYCLHECCINLPIQMKPQQHPNSSLRLTKMLPQDKKIVCLQCHSQCKGFFYQCPNIDGCNFHIDVLCAMPIGNIKIKHQSHSHELVPIRSKLSSNCGACQTKHEDEPQEERGSGISYMCTVCSFWIHRDCALLPNTIRHRNHHFDDDHHLLYLHYIRDAGKAFFARCFLCCEIISTQDSFARYNCTGCESTAHVKCATSNPHNFCLVKRRDAIRGLAHFPMSDEHKSVVSFLLENTSSSNKSIEQAPRDGEMKMLNEIHNHPLMFQDHFPNQGDEGPEALIQLCNVCVEPISPPFYSCLGCNDFLLHRCCSNLPKLSHLLHNCRDVSHSDHRTIVKPYTQVQRSSVYSPLEIFWPDCCQKFSNAVVKYGCESCSGSIDVGCAFLPRVITHMTHTPTHILILNRGELDIDYFCVCCHQWGSGKIGYECSSCKGFKMCVRCALLPMSVTHKFDGHPIKLISRPDAFLSNNPIDNFCGICEETVGATAWFYGCEQCNHSFHVDCIPCVSRLCPKFKFGGTIRVEGHDCPLTCIRMLTSDSCTCSACHEEIPGRTPGGIGLECSKCGYWMHEDCARQMEIEEEE